MKITNDSSANFFQNEIKPLLAKFGSRAKIAHEIGVSPSLIHEYLHGRSSPTIQTILKLAILNEKTTGEKIELFCERWCTVYNRKYPGPHMTELAIALRKEPLVKIHTTNLIPMMRLLATTNMETITISDIEFLLITEEKIGYKLNAELVVNLLKLRSEDKQT